MAKVIAESEGPFSENSEYEVKYRTVGSEVLRRTYKDFADLSTNLLKQFPYRMVPAFPPKQRMQEMLPDERCRGLQIWLNVVRMNSVLKRSPMVLIFLNAVTPHYRNLLHDEYKKSMEYCGNEFYNLQLSIPDKDRLSALREHLPKTFRSLKELYIVFDEQSKPVDQQTHTTVEIDAILRDLQMEGLKGIDICATEASQSERDKSKALVNGLVNLLAAYMDLCERTEKEFPEMAGIHVDDADQDTSSSGIGSTPAKQELNQPAQMKSTTENPNDAKCTLARHCILQETAVVERFLKFLPAAVFGYANKKSEMIRTLAQFMDYESIPELQFPE